MNENGEYNKYAEYSEYIEAGKITAAHSFKGEVKIQSWCDSAEFLTRFKIFYLNKNSKDGGNPLNINAIRVQNEKRGLLIASFEGIDSEEAAGSLRGKIIYIKKQDANLTDGTFFISDLLGLPVYDFNTGVKYGILSDIFNNGASDIYVVKTDVLDKNGKNNEVMIPNVPAFVKKVSVDDSGKNDNGVYITPIDGMF